MDLTVNEKVAVSKFRTKLIEQNLNLRLEDFQDDQFLIRWLRARDHNVDKASAMIKKYLDWRTNNESIVSVLNGTWTPPQFVIEGMRFEVTGFDNDGRPIIWMPIGQHHTKELCENGHRHELQKYTYYHFERLLDTLAKRREATGATQIVAFLDMKDLYFSKVAHFETVQFLLTFFRDFESYYPEILHTAFVVNAAWVFFYIFGILKPILSSHTLGKIQIFPCNEATWKPALLANIPISSLPKEYH